MQISGGNFPPGKVRQSLASVVGLSKLGALGLIIFGSRMNVFERFQIPEPQIYTWASQNKVCTSALYCFIELLQLSDYCRYPCSIQLKNYYVAETDSLVSIIEMINAVYWDRPLIFSRTTFREKLISHYQVVKINC